MKIKKITSKTIDVIVYTLIYMELLGLFFSILGCIIFAFMSKWEMSGYSLVFFGYASLSLWRL